MLWKLFRFACAASRRRSKQELEDSVAYPGRGSRLSLRESPDAKSPREGRVSPLPGPTSLSWERDGRWAFLFLTTLEPTPVTARPPAGRAGGSGGVSGGKGCGFLYPKPSPWGEGGPAQPGRMRGRPGTQRSRRKPAYRRQAVGHWFSTRKGFGVIAPSSVCFADSFPPRGSRWTWQVNRPYPICTKRLPQPAQLGGGPLPASDAGPQARIQKERDTPKDIPNQSGASRGEKLSPLVFFPPFLTGEMEAAGRHPPGALRPEAASEARPEGSVTHGGGGQAPGPTGQGLTCAASKWYGVPTPPRPRHKKGPGQPARSFLLRYCRVG